MRYLDSLDDFKPRSVVQTGVIIFTTCILFDYACYPHWVTLSGFVVRWYTLVPFLFAMLVSVFMLCYMGGKLYRYIRLRSSSLLLFTSAFFAGLIICIPYAGGPAQKDIHDLVTGLFAFSATIAFGLFALRQKNYLLGILSGVQLIVCALEPIFLARYHSHPIPSWGWTILELTGIVTMAASLYVIASALDANLD